MTRVLLMIGTRKGAFMALATQDRSDWQVRGPFLKGAEVNHVAGVPDDGAEAGIAVYACGKSAWWGPGVQVSRDLGNTWEEIAPVHFPEDRDLSVERIWALATGPASTGEGVALYAGVDPGALFLREGDGWREVRSLTDHPTRNNWQPGAGGMMVHSICCDPHDPERLFVGVSAAGVFRTDDGGVSWLPKNRGVRADFLPDPLPAVGQCVHHLEMHPSDPRVLYQQNHCGVYRSDDAGDSWIDLSDGLPSRFGFPLAVHPHHGDTIYVVPEESDEYRATPEGAFRIYRSRDRGDSWTAMTEGLPQRHAWVNVLRHGMCVDTFEPAGIYVGTQGGQVLLSCDDGDSWETVFGWLPPVYSVEAVVI